MVSASNFVSVDKNSDFHSVNAFLPKKAFIPLFEEDGEDSEILVSEGMRVKEGDVIAKSRGLYVHASIPGIVKKIERHQYSNGKQGLCAEIALEGAFSYLGKNGKSSAGFEDHEWKSLDTSTLLFMLKEGGVLNTFDKKIPLFSQIKSLRSKNATLVLRLFESDPSFVTETFLAKTYLDSVLEGSAIAASAFGAKTVLVCYPASDKKFEPVLAESSKKLFENFEVTPVLLPVDIRKYPAGTKHDLAFLAKKTFKNNQFENLGKKDLFIDSAAALASYTAVVLRKPVMSAFVHVTGACLNAAAIMNVRIGTPLRSLVEQCGSFKRTLSKIVINGVMSGKAVSSLDIPIDSGVKSVEFIPKSEVRLQNPETCIRCGNCRKICPLHLWPGNLYRIAHLESMENACTADKDAFRTMILCSECSLCNSVCPSRLPLSQTISLLKNKELQEYEK